LLRHAARERLKNGTCLASFIMTLKESTMYARALVSMAMATVSLVIAAGYSGKEKKSIKKK
jgi:hypothetical protein